MSKLLKKLIALGLVATMAMTSTVTSFAEGEGTTVTETETPTTGEENTEEEKKEEADEAVVWVNGKDVKANTKKKIEAKLNKTYVKALADLMVEGTTDSGDVTTPASSTEAPESSDVSDSQTEAPANEVADGSDSSSQSEAPAEDPKESESTSTTKPAEEEKVVAQVGLNKTLGAKVKYLVSVTDKEVTDYTKAFPNNKANKSNLAKATYKAAKAGKNEANITVTAGKEAGAAKVWVAEFDSAKKAIIAYNFFEVEVKMAPSKFTVQIPGKEAVEEKKDSEGNVIQKAQDAVAPITKKATVNVTEEVELEVKIDKPVDTDGKSQVSAGATYTWTVKAPKGAKETTNYTIVSNGTAATFTALAMTTATKADKYTLTCTNDQSGKKSTFAVTVTNDMSDVKILDVKMESAAEAAQETKLQWNTEAYKTTTAAAFKDGEDVVYATTDKVKVYISEAVDTESAKTWELNTSGKAPKFKLTGTKSKALTAKMAKDGTITLKAKKGTAAGTQAQVILAVTHADKTIDVYTFVVTIGAKAEEKTPVIAVTDAEKKEVKSLAVTVDEADATTKVEVTNTVEKAVLTAAVTVDGEATTDCTATLKDGVLTVTASKAGTYTVTISYGIEGEKALATAAITVTATAATSNEPAEPTCTCNPAPAEGEPHTEGCPLYEAPATA